MTALNTPTSGPLQMEASVNDFITHARAKASEQYRSCEATVRQHPARSVLLAVGAGYCAHRVSMQNFAVAHVRFFAALAPPLLAAYGALKLYDLLRTEVKTGAQTPVT